jgi:cysteine desulfurase
MLFSIYLDCHATTPVDPRVLDAMLPYFAERFGNAASRTHRYGWDARDAVETARQQVAALIGADARDIVFTSGATESDNLAVKGVAEINRARGRHIVTSVVEHSAVIDSCRWLEAQGVAVTYLPVEPDGRVDPDRVEHAITPDTLLISIMAANNEIGTLQPVEAIGRIARRHGVLFHSDAVQAVGKVPFSVDEAQVDLVSLTAHKMYGPKGVGALYVRRRDPRVELAPITHGGGQERAVRSGTLNVPGIVGFGRAAEICREEMASEARRVGALRDRLWAGLAGRLTDVALNGSMAHRLPQNLNASFAGVEGESLLMGLTDIALSSGAACTSANREPSRVLKAIGLSDEMAYSALRFGLGRFTTAEEVDHVVARVVEVVTRLRAISPLAEQPGDDELAGVEWQAD